MVVSTSGHAAQVRHLVLDLAEDPARLGEP